jgi:hypothetical protein
MSATTTREATAMPTAARRTIFHLQDAEKPGNSCERAFCRRNIPFHAARIVAVFTSQEADSSASSFFQPRRNIAIPRKLHQIFMARQSPKFTWRRKARSQRFTSQAIEAMLGIRLVSLGFKLSRRFDRKRIEKPDDETPRRTHPWTRATPGLTTAGL